MKSKALLNFASYTDGGLESKANTIIVSMTGNDDFPAPVPELAIVSTALESYSEALAAAASGNRADVAIKNTKRQELTLLLRSLATYVTYTAADDRSKLLTSGFDISKEPAPIIITKPENIQVTNGLNPGELQLSVRRVKGATSYMHEYILHENVATDNWLTSTSTSAKYTFDNLQAGKQYICRVGAVGTKGQLVYSDQVSRIVL